MPSFTPQLRLRFLSPLIILLVIFGLAFEYQYNYFLPKATFLIPSSKRPIFESNGEFWPSFAPLLAAAAPRVEPPELTQNAGIDLQSEKSLGNNESQTNFLRWSQSDIASMKGVHEWFLAQIQSSNPPKLQYQPGTKGIVTSAGGGYFPVLLVILRMLRRTGSTLPVEIFLKSKDEYEEVACELFKELGATCVVLSEFFEDFRIRFDFQHYQLKGFGMLFSSYEEILFLDADNFPVRKPEDLFETEIYKERGMVLWQDY